MSGSLVTKLQRFTELDKADRGALGRFEAEVRDFRAGSDVITQGTQPDRVHLLVQGWACRYKLLATGKRQIVAYLIPGDLCDVHVFVLRRMDHSIGVLGPAKVALISPQLMLDTMDRHPRIARALWWATLVDEGVLREWLVNLGRRNPYERVAHLLCEMWVRMNNVGLAPEDCFSLPVTQADIGDTMGLTPVTVNRVLQRMRRADLITLEDGELTILDVNRLTSLSSFDSAYLHGERERAPAATCSVATRAERPRS